MVFRRFSKDDTGAIAPLYALSLFGLIGMAGVGFDYARVMALDTELQNAADQAALAAASQLDGKADSITRAQAAVNNYFAKAGGAYVNQTRLSNIDDDGDGDTRSITQVSFAFWEDYVNDQPTNPVALTASDSSEAEVVQVSITQRALRYALTPIVGAIVGRAGASAMASVESAFCKVPPLMVCVPNANFGANDATGTSPDRGTGVMLHMLPNSKAGPDATDAESVSLTPGIFGFLDFPYPSPVGGNPNTSLGWEVANPSCTGETVDSEPGVRSPEAGALASRFDVGSDCLAGGTFCPASNTTKNRVYRISSNTDPASFTCPSNPISGNTAAAEANGGGEGWVAMSDADLAGASSPGYPRDNSHTGNIGNKVWDIASYFSANYGSTVGAVTGGALTASATRYDVYNWQKANPSSLTPRLVAQNISKKPYKYYCAYPKPIGKHASMTLPTTTKDRRVLSLAAVDCTGLNGRSPVDILRYIDVFLVEPPLTSASDKEFYVEVIGETSIPGGTTFQTFAKRKAVLLR
ncbi:pilus assembly protein TadG-related protein [Croceicoccus sp. BE223]|uniref:TadE/TadG family type IV pilus assembly protein n=1 Tax=Croceicoccus sp. BE223 TaxID=2817716 RepID=UPI002864A395|nr:pilus assembly protein TadG-related protein [Croceicoccus sp. BE223]MDR7102634.1 Flp pilus assembly protein TadG [Croceicoccus sp. BE223]